MDGSLETNRRLRQVAETISRESVIKAIADLMLNHVADIGYLEKQSASESSEQQERIRQDIKMDEKAIFALIKVAADLELYEDVNGRIIIPKRIKEAYWGPEHPNAHLP